MGLHAPACRPRRRRGISSRSTFTLTKSRFIERACRRPRTTRAPSRGTSDTPNSRPTEDRLVLGRARAATPRRPTDTRSTGLSARRRQRCEIVGREPIGHGHLRISKIERRGGRRMSDPNAPPFRPMQALGLAETFNIMLQADRDREGTGQLSRGIVGARRHVDGRRQAGHAARQADPRGRRHDHRRGQRQRRRESGPSCAPSSISSCCTRSDSRAPRSRSTACRYNELLEKLKGFFAAQGACTCAWRSCRATPGGAAASAAAKSGARGTLVMVIVIVIALAAAAGVTWYLTHRPQ